jgi:tetrahydromethanopterin S-methyltransferase subunit B
MGKSIAEQRDDLIAEQLRSIKEVLNRLEGALAVVTGNLDAVRITELNDLRAKISAIESALQAKISAVDTTVQILSYQAKRSGAFAGAWISAVISLVVAAGGALLLRHSG